MSETNGLNENIKLSLPVNAAYVSAARLTASSIANRLGFDIDEIEDIKAAVSEACTFVIKKLPPNITTEFTIIFSMEQSVFKIEIGTCVSFELEESQEEMSIIMIKALMDDFNITNNTNFKITMTKKHNEISFE